jgi:hypothetical protein
MKIRVIQYLISFFIFSIAGPYPIQAQDTLHVLFLGNSYTAVNNLPLMVKNMAAAAGITINAVQNAPGGHTVENHLSNTNTLIQIRKGIWDYVVIQEQSQIPTIDHYRYNSMYPSLLQLKDSILRYNACTQIVTYMTWGRRFGGQQCDGSGTYCSPDFRDFNHMQDSLRIAYIQISDSMNVQCAPVGVSWQQVINDTTLILHQGDNSHPNLNGSYLAACTLFSSILKQKTTGISYTAGLPASLAAYFQTISDQTVFSNNNEWNLAIYQPIADFTTSITGHIATFSNESVTYTSYSPTYQWHFGDGDSSMLQEPVHTYGSPGTYVVRLIVSTCSMQDTIQKTILVAPTSIDAQPIFSFFPNPTSDFVEVRIQSNNNIVFPQALELKIINTQGQLVQKEKYVLSTAPYIVRINIRHLPAGLYLVSVGNKAHPLLIAR